MITIDLPAVDSDVNVFVTAMNVFGSADPSDVATDEISELIMYTYLYICVLLTCVYHLICTDRYVRMYVRMYICSL